LVRPGELADKLRQPVIGWTTALAARAQLRVFLVSHEMLAKNQSSPTNDFLDWCAPECDNGMQPA